MTSYLPCSVYLLSAGPGDPSLVPLKTIDILRLVDVVLYDYLAHPSLLKYCKRDPVLMCVGKRKGEHSVQQSNLLEIIYDFVSQGKVVARLKGGDALTFSRGGEEIDFLNSHNISYDCVPGVSAFNGVLGDLGIPMTHRDNVRSVALLSASLKDSDFSGVVKIPHVDTLVFFMVMTHVELVLERLREEVPHISDQTPVMVVSSGTLSNEKIITGTVSSISSLINDDILVSPVLMLVGENVSYYDSAKRLDRRPLSGQRVWVFRQDSDQDAYRVPLTLQGAEVIGMPLISIEPIEGAKYYSRSELDHADTIIFSSSNGVRCFFKWLSDNRYDVRLLAQKTCCCIGAMTAQTLASFGLFSDYTPSHSSSEGFIADFPFDMEQINALLPIAEKGRRVIADEIVAAGGNVTVWPIYETKSTLPVDYPLRPDDVFVFSSPSVVDVFFRKYCELPDGGIAIAFGSFTADALKEKGVEHILQLDSPSPDALVKLLKEHLK